MNVNQSISQHPLLSKIAEGSRWLGKDEFPELKKAIIKRELAITNCLIGLLSEMKDQFSSSKLEEYQNRFYAFREKLLDLRFSL